MRANSHSRTAEVTAAIRAGHYLYDSPRIFDDPFAISLTSPIWRTVFRSKPLHRLIVRGLLGSLRPVHGWILVRDRLTELTLETAVAAGTDQYVLLGAGFDSTALRRPPWLSKTRIIEVDYPATQQLKRKRTASIKSLNDDDLLDLVAVDFEQEDLANALSRSAYSSERPALFAWQGVVYYLTASAIDETLRSVAQVAAKGSELLFDFLLPKTEMATSDRWVQSSAGMFTARLGERYVSFHSVDEISTLLTAHGFGIKRIWLDEELERMFLRDRRDGLAVMRGFGIAQAVRL